MPRHYLVLEDKKYVFLQTEQKLKSRWAILKIFERNEDKGTEGSISPPFLPPSDALGFDNNLQCIYSTEPWPTLSMGALTSTPHFTSLVISDTFFSFTAIRSCSAACLVLNIILTQDRKHAHSFICSACGLSSTLKEIESFDFLILLYEIQLYTEW